MGIRPLPHRPIQSNPLLRAGRYCYCCCCAGRPLPSFPVPPPIDRITSAPKPPPASIPLASCIALSPGLTLVSPLPICVALTCTLLPRARFLSASRCRPQPFLCRPFPFSRLPHARKKYRHNHTPPPPHLDLSEKKGASSPYHVRHALALPGLLHSYQQ